MKFFAIAVVFALTGCATQQDLARLSPEELCAKSAGVGIGFNLPGDFQQSIQARGISCAPYQSYIEMRLRAQNDGMAQASATLQAMQNQKIKELNQQQQQAPTQIKPFNCYPNNQPYGPAFTCR